MTVDTQYLAKGLTVGRYVPFVNTVYNNLFKNTGYDIAWRMTASALKNSVKDMYTGELIIIGDPTLKPYDRVTICDTFEGINGDVEVEAVVHSFSIETGFVTSVHPDCINCIDDRYEQISHNIVKGAIGPGLITYLSSLLLYAAYAKHGRPMVNAAYRAYKDTLTPGIKSTFDSFSNRKKDVKSDKAKGKVLEKIEKATQNEYAQKIVSNLKGNLKGAIGISDTSLAVSRFYNSARRLGSFIDSFDTIDTVQDLIRYSEGVSSHLKNTNIDDTIKALEKELPNMSANDKKEAQEMIESLKKHSDSYAKIFDHFKMDTNDLDTLIKHTKGKESKAVLEAIKKNGGKISSTEELNDFAKAIKNLPSNNEIEKAIKGIGSAYTKNKTNILNGTKFINEIATSNKFSTLRKLKLGAKMGSIFKIVGNLGLFVFDIVICSFVNEYIERWMKNLQVIQVFPIVKHGRVLTAGLDGNQGSVVGSPTENNPGPIENLLIKMFGDSDDSDSSFIGSTVKGIAQFLFVSEEMTEIANNFKRDNNAFPGATTSIDRNNLIESVLKSVVKDEMQTNDASKAIKLKDRINNFSDKTAKQAYAYYSFKSDDVKTISDELISQQMVPVIKQKYIDDLVKMNYVKFIHNELYNESNDLTDNNGKIITKSKDFYGKLETFKVNLNETVSIPVIYDKNVFDIPFLKNDAYQILLNIIKKIESEFSISMSHYGDGKTKEEMFKKHPISIMSCLRVNDKGWASTGYTFTLQLVNAENLKDIIEPIKQEYKDIFVVQYIGKDKCKIVVYPEKQNFFD